MIPIGRGRLAAGHASGHGSGKGVEIVDTRRDTRRMLDRCAGAVAHGAGRVLVYDGRARIGLTAYRAGGARAFRALRGWRIQNVQVAGRHAYAIAPRRMAIVDLRSGRVVRRSPAPRALDVELLAPR